jgi:DNA helicase-2/ATP-dependent DNA helicase PcrA
MSRRLYNSDSYNLPSRFLDELPENLVERWNGSGKSHEPRAGSYGWGITSREPRAESREPSPKSGGLRYEAEESFVDHLQMGKRVRHPEWGIGTIRERIGEGEDLKVVVTFAGVGRKKLAASFVRLERA